MTNPNGPQIGDSIEPERAKLLCPAMPSDLQRLARRVNRRRTCGS